MYIICRRCLVQSYGISTFVGYLIPNTIFTCKKGFVNKYCGNIFKKL